MIFTTLVGCLIAVVSSEECWRQRDVLLCDDNMPNEVQAGITIVKIFNVDLNAYLQTDIFQHRSWRTVEHLVLKPDMDSSGGNSLDVETRPSFVLPSTFSDYLYNLVELSVTSENLIGLHKGAFHNLTKLEVLDFAGNVGITLTNFTAALLGNNMDNLKILNISQISVRSPLIRTFGGEFFDCFRSSHLEELDLSKTDSLMIPGEIADALPFLKSINLGDSGYLAANFMAAMYLNPNGRSFKFLRKLNINNALFPDSLTDAKLLLPADSDISATAQLNLTHLWARNCVLDEFESIPFAVSLENRAILYMKYEATNISRPIVALPVDSMGAIPLKVLDISQNGIISMDLNLTAMSRYMEDIDLSNNKLYLMDTSKIKHIFKNTPNIYRINLSNNRLSKLPDDIFSTNTNLEYLDLSHNRLSTLDFKFSHLIKLKVLNVSFNEIHYFEHNMLSRLYFYRQSVLLYSEEFSMQLSGNPFVCSCESKEFLRWILDPGFSNYIQPQNFKCLQSQSQTSISIDENASADAEFECKLTLIIGVCSAVSGTLIIILGIATLLMCRRYRSKRKERKLALFIAKRNDRTADEQTPIFLSYCSENDDFVSNVIYPTLNSSLQKILKTDKTCIATGDLDFRPGIHVAEEIVTCISNCSVLVACVSKAFCKKTWCKNEVFTAIHEQRPVVLILLEEVELSLMPKVLRKHFLTTTRVTWTRHDITPKPDVQTICRGIVQLMAKEQDDSNVIVGNNGCLMSEDGHPSGYHNENAETIL
ncbi:toll-like receptor 4 [Mya arenaria]|uniref:toll-like receptor 4 n=1 Tax=Mya arenaria TaxID=6604 RepID=UPI0022E484D9|nr:toll-like receptor 4 [Mya arenaria]